LASAKQNKLESGATVRIGSFDDDRPNQVSLSTLTRPTILATAAATLMRRRRDPPVNAQPPPFYTAKNVRLWTGVHVV
jgi:hypothetical protein